MFAERLRLIRQARSMSLDELSEATGRLITKQALSKYEKGLDVPSRKVLLALGKALGTGAAALFEVSQYAVETLYYRTKSGLPKREQERLESILSFRLEQSLRVRDLVQPGAPFDLPVREYRVSTAEEVEEAAVRLRRKWGSGLDPLRNVVDLLEENGVVVCCTEADGKFDGLSAVARTARGRATGAAVLCRTELTRERQRLNLAHELAHLVLAPDDSGREEVFAWRFAGAFLAPEATLKQDIGATRRSISLDEMLILKRKYGMSIQALMMRFHAIGILSDEAKRAAFIQLSRQGLRREEPDDTHEPEKPRWFQATVLRAVSEGLLTGSEATAMLGERVDSPSGRLSLTRLLASMPVSQRQPILNAVMVHESPNAEYDAEWVDMDEDYGA